MFGEEWNERIETYVSVFIFGAIFLYVIVRFHGYRLKHHLKEKKWFLITSVATLVIGCHVPSKRYHLNPIYPIPPFYHVIFS